MAFLVPIVASIAGNLTVQYLGGSLLGYIAGGVVAAGIGNLLTPEVEAPDSLESMRTQGRQENISNPAQPIPIIYGTVRVGGSRVFADTTGTDNRYLHTVIALGEGEINDITAVYLDDLDATDAKFSGLVDYGDGMAAHKGSDTQTADSQLVSRVTAWTTDHRLLGTAYVYVRLDFDAEAFPRMPVITADVEGRMVYDVRDASTKFSNNSALCIYDYMTDTRSGMGIPSSEIDTASFQTAANICDTVVDGQVQYTCDGVVDTDRPVIDNLKELLSSCRGMIIFTGGKYRLVIDEAESTVYSFTEDNITGAWTLNFDSRALRKNRVRARYFSETRRYQPDFIIQDSTTYRTEDNGTLLEQEITLPFTTNYKRAQRIAEQELKQSRFSKMVEFNALMDGLRVEVGDVIDITHSTTGWVTKQFRVLGLEYNSQNEVRIRCREYDGSVYSGGTLPTESTPPTAANPRPNDVLSSIPTDEESITWIDTFENDVDGWTGSGATIAQDAAAAVGTAAALFTGTGFAAGDYVEYDLPNSFWYAATIPGRRVRVQFWHKQPGTNASNNVRVELTNGTDTANLDVVPTASYQSAGFLFAPTVIGTSLKLRVYPDRDATNEAVLIDNITCFVVPDLIDASSISNWMDTLAVGEAYIASLAVTESKIGNLAVTEAKIGTAAVTNAKIGTAAVDTLEIQGNAVTVPVGSYAAAAESVTTTWETIASISITTPNTPHTILFSSQAQVSTSLSSGSRGCKIRLLQGGTEVVAPITLIDETLDAGVTKYANANISYTEATPGSSSVTWSVQAASTVGAATASFSMRSMVGLGTKR